VAKTVKASPAKAPKARAPKAALPAVPKYAQPAKFATEQAVAVVAEDVLSALLVLTQVQMTYIYLFM